MLNRRKARNKHAFYGNSGAGATGAAATVLNSFVAGEEEADRVIKHLRMRANKEEPTASHLLATLYQRRGHEGSGTGTKSDSEVIKALAETMRRRAEYIQKKARQRSASKLEGKSYTEDSWIQWMNRNSLTDPEMTEAVKDWKKSFEATGMLATGKEKVEVLKKEGSRRSKSEAHSFVNGAWKADLAQRFGFNPQIAIYLLKFPSTAFGVECLLSKWEECRLSDDYMLQKERSRDITSAKRCHATDITSAMRDLKKQQRLIKEQTLRLRNVRRRATAIYKKLEKSGYQDFKDLPSQDRDLVALFRSGILDKALDSWTAAHGYGRRYTAVAAPDPHDLTPGLLLRAIYDGGLKSIAAPDSDDEESDGTDADAVLSMITATIFLCRI